MMKNQKNDAFPNGLIRFAAVASLLFLLPAAGAESQQNVVSELSTQDEIQKFCTNIADAARDQRRNIGAGFDAVKQVQTACGDIRDTRREPEPKQMT